MNRRPLQSVSGSHWQIWPDMSEAVPNSRNFLWNQWLDVFLKRARIGLVHALRPPPFEGEQLEFKDVERDCGAGR